ncbi:MAG TPA: efflux RND transporter periplasmic adaptor subunit [Burkholderiales bacterium]|nr:efflux RND transporter periplasmic adaptor subunit [Burkholderiales bacterium]
MRTLTPRRLLLSVGIVVLVGAAVAAGLATVRKNQAAEPSAREPALEFLSSDILVLAPQTLERSLPLTGTLTPLNETTVKAKVAGELVEVTVREGENVRRGQVLARIDTTELAARAAAKRADVEAARAQLVLAEKNRANQKTLLEKNFISQSAFDATQSAYEVALARLRAAEADLAVAQKALGDAVLSAPIAGIVAQRLAQPGERVPVDARILAIVDLSRLQLEAAVPASEIGRVKVGQPVSFRVDGFGAREFAGHIERINPSTIAGSRSINVYAVIENPDGMLRGGLFAQGGLTLERVEGALLIPATALREELGERFVYRLADGVVRKAPVKTGHVDGAGRVQVLAGLAAGDRVVRRDLGALREGTPARVLDAPRRD